MALTSSLQYMRDLLSDIRSAVEHFRYMRTYLRRGGNPDEVQF